MQAFWVGAKDCPCTPQRDQSVQGIHCRCAPAARGYGGVPRCAAHPTQPHGHGQQPHSILSDEKVSSLKLGTLVALGGTVTQKSNCESDEIQVVNFFSVCMNDLIEFPLRLCENQACLVWSEYTPISTPNQAMKCSLSEQLGINKQL